MKAVCLEDVQWSRQRWIAIILACSALQLAGVFLLSEGKGTALPPLPVEPRMAMVPEAAGRRLLDGHAVSDPTLLALADPRGFSGSPWLNSPPPMHRPLDWSEPESWLNQSTAHLATTFRQFVKTNTAGAPLKTDKPVPATAEVQVAPQVIATHSRLRVDGDLAARVLVEAVVLPNWHHTNVLADSVVQVTVDANGYAHSAVLLGSGPRDALQVQADQFALRWARTNRFAPSTRRVSDGILFFQWQTLPPNGVEKSSAPN